MIEKRWVQWLVVFLGLIAAGAVIGGLLVAQGAQTIGTIVVVCAATAAALWLAGGAFAVAQTRWFLWLSIHTGGAFVGLAISLPFFSAHTTGTALAILGVTAAFRLIVVIRAYLAQPTRIVPTVMILGGFDALLICSLAWMYGFTRSMTAVSGIIATATAFIVGLGLIRMMLSGPRPVFGVARTVLDEAIRMKIALVFIVGLILILPILPVMFDPQMRLQYRMQTFLSWSLIIVVLLMGLMTVFLACATICNEINRHQIFLTMTKPISRAEYLLGKWLGVVLLDLLLLAVLCGGIYTFARVIQVTGQPRDAEDRAALEWQVLTARQTVRPTLDVGAYKQMFARRLEELRRENPSAFEDPKPTTTQREQIHKTLMTKWHTISYSNSQTYEFRGLGQVKEAAVQARRKREHAQVSRLKTLATVATDPDQAIKLNRWAQQLSEALTKRIEATRLREASQSAVDRSEAARLRTQANELASAAGRQWVDAQNAASLHLGKLLNRGPAEVLHLRFKPIASALPQRQRVRLAMRINDRQHLSNTGKSLQILANANFHVLKLPAETTINDKAKLRLQIANVTLPKRPNPPGTSPGISVSFTPNDGLEILHMTGGFEGNLLRAALIIWVGLCFLAMLGLMAGTFLEFPVACMLTLLVSITAISSGFLTDSLRRYGQVAIKSDALADQIGTVWSGFWARLSSGHVWEAIKVVISLVGKAFVAVTPSFNMYNPIPQIADGRLVSMGQLVSAVGWIGLVSTGMCGIIAWLAFRRRELARVMV